MYEEILYAVDGPVATITLSRPDRLNALTRRMLSELRHAIGEAEKDEAVVGIILTGEGRGFCAGMDMQALDKLGASGGTANRVDEDYGLDANPGDPAMGEDFQISYGYLLSVRKPIIAAINGPCAGLGFVIAMLCDMRFVAEEAVLTASFSQRGLIAEHGISWILPRLAGPSVALDILWSSRKIRGAEAKELGIANRVCKATDVVGQARAYLEDLAANAAPISLMIMKQQVYRHLNMPLGPSLEETNQLVAESTAGNDFKEGVAAFLEQRPPQFARVAAE